MFPTLQSLLEKKKKSEDEEMELDFDTEAGEAEEAGEESEEKPDVMELLKAMSPEGRADICKKLQKMVEKDSEEAEPVKEGEDSWTFIVGEDGDTRKTHGDAAKIIKKMLSIMASDIRATGDDEMSAKWKKMKPQLETMTDPAALYKKLIKSDLAWDGYAVELQKNGKTVSQPSVTRY